MKNILLLVFLILAFSCKGKPNNTDVTMQSPQVTDNAIVDDTPIVGPYYDPIDPIEFVAYWHQFCKTVLKHDTTSLAPMLNDYLVGDCIWYIIDGYGEKTPMDLLSENKLPPNWSTKKIHKSLFLDKMDIIFSPVYLSLLKEYDIIEMDFDSIQDKIVIGKKTYFAYMSIQNHRTDVGSKGIIHFENAIIYSMGYYEADTQYFQFRANGQNSG
ncbi:hypothetical protein AGMMS49965_23780 [Bacteroidia bacterium]|nr:hypothetical protein AGMMS49965_23780 [Bacteroidia bacterium]